MNSVNTIASVSQEFKESAFKVAENIRKYVESCKDASAKFMRNKEIIENDIAGRYLVLRQELQAQKDAQESGGSVGLDWTNYNIVCNIKALIYDEKTIGLLDPNTNKDLL